MSVIGTYRTVFGDESGTDGRALTDIDLNEISRNMTRRAWEFPGYAGLVGFDQPNRSYSDAFDGDSSALYSRLRGVYTHGRGLEITPSGLGTSVGSGFLGCYMDGDTPSRPTASGMHKMNWVMVAAGDIAYTHDAAATGKMRWDLITVQLAEANAPTVARHFQDATTGARTSQSVVPARYTTLSAVLTKGTEDVSAPTVPDRPAGGHVLYAVKVSDTTILDVWDFSIPVGNLQDGTVLGREGASPDATWEIDGSNINIKSTSNSAGSAFVFPPQSIRGSASALVLGVSISHQLYSGFTVYVSKVPLAGGLVVDLFQIPGVTADGTDRTKFVELRGFPYDAQTPPLWTNGMSRKGVSAYALALRFVAPSTTNISYVRSVRWYTL